MRQLFLSKGKIIESLGQHATIEFFGRSYTLKAESDTVSAQTVADYLLGEVKEVESLHPGLQSRMSRLDIMILAAMNIASENIELKEKQSVLLKEVFDRSENLIKRLDNCLSHRTI